MSDAANVPADQGAREARLATWVSLLHGLTCPSDGEACAWAEEGISETCGEVYATGLESGLMQLADAEVAAAVSEAQADLSEQLRDARVRLDERTRMCDAADEAADRRLDQSIKWMERAESAEAEVERLREEATRARAQRDRAMDDLERLREGIRALADAPTEHYVRHSRTPYGQCVQADDLRALLAPSPAEEACTPGCSEHPAPVLSGEAEAGESWVDSQGDVWTFDADGIGTSPECANFSRKYVEKKWGPLRPARVVTPSAEDGA